MLYKTAGFQALICTKIYLIYDFPYAFQASFVAKSYGASDLWELFDATSMTRIPTTCLWVTGLCFLKGDVLIRRAFYIKLL